MARQSRSARNSSSRTPYSFQTEAESTEAGTQPGQALYDAPPPGISATELNRSLRSRTRTGRISTHIADQAKTHKISGKILRTKARNQKKAAKAAKKKPTSGGLPDDEDVDEDEDTDGDFEDESGEVHSEVEPNLSADELDNEDGGEQGGAGDEAHNNSNNQAEAEAINREDTDLDSHSLERTLLLQRLNDATDKNFDAHSTPELRSIWKAYREDQEASEEIEVVYPQIQQLEVFQVAVGGGYQPSPTTADPQAERLKRALADPPTTASKRARLSIDSAANPSSIDPPSSQTNPITPPTLVLRPATVPRAPNQLPPHRVQNAPSPSPNTSIFVHPQPRAPTTLGARPSGLTASTVLDKPRSPDLPHAPTPIARSAQLPRPPVPPVASRSAPPVTPRSAPPAASRSVQHLASRPVQPLAPAPRQAQAIAPRQVQATAHRSAQPVASRSAQPSAARAPEAPHRAAGRSTINENGVNLERRAPPSASSGNLQSATTPETAQSRFDINLGGPAPGLPPRVRPYVPYTDLVHDRAEEFAAADARASGRRASGRKQKPHARDYNGDERMMIPFTSKRHFALTLVDNPYGNRLYSRETAKDAYEEEWARLMPGKELKMPNDEYFNLLVNRGATFRGSARDRIRPIAQASSGMIHPARTREDFQFNTDRLSTLLPNKFHYGSLDPPGHPYSNIDISRALGVALFHSMTSVGAVHRRLFGPRMPLQPIAFVLTNFQVCIMEFSTGRFEAIDLNAAAQYQMYLSHARGLEAYAQRAPNRMRIMQEDWYNYAVAFAGLDEEEGEGPASYQDMIPLDDIPADLPAPDSPDAPEEPEPEFEAALDEQVQYDDDGWQSYAHEDLYRDDNTAPTEYEDEPEPELEPEPEPEFDNAGRLTARSKGKGRTAPGSSRR